MYKGISCISPPLPPPLAALQHDIFVRYVTKMIYGGEVRIRKEWIVAYIKTVLALITESEEDMRDVRLPPRSR